MVKKICKLFEKSLIESRAHWIIGMDRLINSRVDGIGQKWQYICWGWGLTISHFSNLSGGPVSERAGYHESSMQPLGNVGKRWGEAEKMAGGGYEGTTANAQQHILHDCATVDCRRGRWGNEKKVRKGAKGETGFFKWSWSMLQTLPIQTSPLRKTTNHHVMALQVTITLSLQSSCTLWRKKNVDTPSPTFCCKKAIASGATTSSLYSMALFTCTFPFSNYMTEYMDFSFFLVETSGWC